MGEQWTTGLAGFTLLRPDQHDIYKFILKNRIDHKNPLLQLSRRFGKTFTTLCYTIDLLMQNPGWVAKWICPDKDMARTIVMPEFDKIMEDCPEHLKPKFQSIDSFYRFPNGSKLFLMGVSKDKGKTARGAFSHLIVCDEFGFWNCPEIVETILMPQLLTTRGQLIIVSTPPEDLAHPYYAKVSLAKADNTFIQRVIYDNGMLTQWDIDKAIKDSGGIDSPAFRREYLCEPVSNPEKLVLPEFKESVHVGERQINDQWTHYVGMDLGFNDYTAVIFASVDFVSGLLYVQDEILLNGKNSKEIAEACIAKERTIWDRPPWRRVSDNDVQQLYDFQTLYGYSVLATKKDDKMAAINSLRLRFTAKKIVIHPRCKSLIFQAQTGLWNDRRTDFMRSAISGHLDAIDALIYLNRNVDPTYNPVQETFDPFSQFKYDTATIGDQDFQILAETLNIANLGQQ